MRGFCVGIGCGGVWMCVEGVVSMWRCVCVLGVRVGVGVCGFSVYVEVLCEVCEGVQVCVCVV